MNTTPPCSKCNSACCRQFGNAKFAVGLEDDEDFPEAKLYKLPSGKVRGLPFKDGKCIHLGDDNLCKVYDKRPKMCRQFNCLYSYYVFGNAHGNIIQHNPHLVPLIQLNAPDFAKQRELERAARSKTPS